VQRPFNRIITEGKERFHTEKEDILKAGVEVSGHINVDDTGARHKGRNGYCTHIGNELFAWFQSTESKSRINFLELLRAGHTDYSINADALAYMEAQRFPGMQLSKFTALCDTSFESLQKWEENLQSLHITDERHIRIATEGALLGKDYKKFPGEEKKALIEEKFDEICKTKTCFISLNNALKRSHKNKSELLMVLERPDIPLHNNLSENDIREYVKKRKISGSTRSDPGRRCRDTFTSLKKTCRKLGIPFWEYLTDRITGRNAIPLLPDLVRLRAL